MTGTNAVVAEPSTLILIGVGTILCPPNGIWHGPIARRTTKAGTSSGLLSLSARRPLRVRNGCALGRRMANPLPGVTSVSRRGILLLGGKFTSS